MSAENTGAQWRLASAGQASLQSALNAWTQEELLMFTKIHGVVRRNGRQASFTDDPERDENGCAKDPEQDGKGSCQQSVRVSAKIRFRIEQARRACRR
jgi:hypothetical protein